MQKLIIKYFVSDECTYSCDVILPVNFKSKSKLEDLFLYKLNDKIRNKNNDSYQFSLSDNLDYIFDYSDFITDKEIRQLPEILTLEEWFEKEKINK